MPGILEAFTDHPWENFKEGVAGIGDALGLTTDAAAKEYAEEQANATLAAGGSAEAAAAAKAAALESATSAEEHNRVLERAASQTAQDFGNAGKGLVSGIFSALSWLKWVLIVAVLFVVYLAFKTYAPKGRSE